MSQSRIAFARNIYDEPSSAGTEFNPGFAALVFKASRDGSGVIQIPDLDLCLRRNSQPLSLGREHCSDIAVQENLGISTSADPLFLRFQIGMTRRGSRVGCGSRPPRKKSRQPSRRRD